MQNIIQKFQLAKDTLYHPQPPPPPPPPPPLMVSHGVSIVSILKDIVDVITVLSNSNDICDVTSVPPLDTLHSKTDLRINMELLQDFRNWII